MLSLRQQSDLLLRPRERGRSIVMSTSVCLSVCSRDLYRLWSWLGPPPTGGRNPKGEGAILGFSSPITVHCNAFAAKRDQPIGREGVTGVHSTAPAKCDLYERLVSVVICDSVRLTKLLAVSSGKCGRGKCSLLESMVISIVIITKLLSGPWIGRA